MNDKLLNDLPTTNPCLDPCSVTGSKIAHLFTPEGFEGGLIQVAFSIFISGIVHTLHMNGLHPLGSL